MPLQQNIDRMAGHFRSRGVAWRPHAKAFKCPAIAHLLRRAGAIGVTVAKVSEAEVMAAGGIDDILIAHLVVGPSKAARLAALQRQSDVKVTVDIATTWPHSARRPRRRHDDRRAGGCRPRHETNRRRDPRSRRRTGPAGFGHLGLRFDGLMGYEGHT